LAVAYNVPEVKDADLVLNLSAAVIEAIYEGVITSWDDARIAELNPDASLPAQPITVIMYTDDSTSTFILTEGLSKMGVDVDPSSSLPAVWAPTGRIDADSGDIATKLEETEYAIAYVTDQQIIVLSSPLPPRHTEP